MKKEVLQKLINKYIKQYPGEDISPLIDFLKDSDNPYNRSNLTGHITCSSWIVNDDLDEVFLIHHKKYDKWLQPGGHMESGEDIFEAGLREGMEETGFDDLYLLSGNIFDIDIHKIPASDKKGEPEHYHYDIRLITGSIDQNINVDTKEVKGYKWTKLTKLKLITNDESLSRMVDKTQTFKLKPKKQQKNTL